VADPKPELSAPAPAGSSESHLRQLTPLLVWAVVFCDIGTSVYYVPGVLYREVGDVAPFFVILGLIGFVLLAFKYVEICWRNPDGGGVVSVSTQAFTPLAGAFGGILITIGYFVTSAISSVSGIHYLGTVLPWLEEHVVAMSVVTLLFLAIVNTIGIRESAMLSLVMAAGALVVGLFVVGMVAFEAGDGDWQTVRANIALAQGLDTRTFLLGFSGAWLAFSGLESISQLSPAMRLPITETSRKGMRLVIVTMIATSPFLTLFAISLLPAELKNDAVQSERLISLIAGQFGGYYASLAVVITGSALLLLAANTALIGSYHVFLSLTEKGFMPSAIAFRNRKFGTPQLAILVATIVPVLMVMSTSGHTDQLAGLYAFGLLGAFVMSSAGLDLLRWRNRERGWRMWIGVATTALVLVAWVVTLYVKQEATLWGSLLVLLGLLMAVGTRRKWFTGAFYNIPVVARLLPKRILESEGRLEASQTLDILTLAQASAITGLYPSSTLIALRTPNPGLVAEAIARERGRGGSSLFALYVEERTGLFVRSQDWQPKVEGVDSLRSAVRAAEAEGVTLIPVYTVSYDAVEGIVRSAEALGVSGVMIGVTQRNSIYHLLRGHVLAGLTKRLPPGIRILLYG